MISYNRLILILVIMAGVLYYFADDYVGKAKGKIEVYEENIRSMEGVMATESVQRDSLRKLIASQQVAMDSMSKEVVVEYVYHTERKEKRDEKVNLISDMSTDDKYKFFEDR